MAVKHPGQLKRNVDVPGNDALFLPMKEGKNQLLSSFISRCRLTLFERKSR
jgi:hypothetical protein